MAEKVRVALGSDHVGFARKEKVREYLAKRGFEVEDHGPVTPDPVDYPDFAEKVATSVAAKEADCGVLVCGTGLGVAIAANKVLGIRAATCNDTISAMYSRSHNDANVLTMGGQMTDDATAEKILDIWFSTAYEGGRHQRRIDKIAQLDEKHHTEK